MQDGIRRHLESQLAQLEDLGFVPVVPVGGPPGAACYDRVGLVRASRLSVPLAWNTHAGEQMYGGWRVIDEGGNSWTVPDSDFQATHEPAGGDRGRRVGVYRAWQVDQATVIRTKEGRATTQQGDWIVEAPTGERWPVPDEQFRRNYRYSPDQAIAPQTSSSTAPAIPS